MRTAKKTACCLLAGMMLALTGCTTGSTVAAGSPMLPQPPDTAPPGDASSDTSTVPAGTGTSDPAPIRPGKVVRAVRSVDRSTTLGAVVTDLATGDDLLTVNADRRFRSASLVKLLIAIDVLTGPHGRHAGDRVSTMLSVSDDALASEFWVSGGGYDIVARTATTLGLTGVAPPADPGMWGHVLLTPRDVVTTYRYIGTELPARHRDRIITALADAPRVAADGFDQHFGIPDGLTTDCAIKQGWGNDDTTVFLHSTGLVGAGARYAVVLLTEHPRSTPPTAAADAVTAGAAALAGTLPGL